MDPLLHTIDDAAKALGIGRTTMYNLAAAGEVAVVHIGRRALVTAESLRAYVDRLLTAEPPIDPLAGVTVIPGNGHFG